MLAKVRNVLFDDSIHSASEPCDNFFLDFNFSIIFQFRFVYRVWFSQGSAKKDNRFEKRIRGIKDQQRTAKGLKGASVSLEGRKM